MSSGRGGRPVGLERPATRLSGLPGLCVLHCAGGHREPGGFAAENAKAPALSLVPWVFRSASSPRALLRVAICGSHVLTWAERTAECN